MIDSNDGEGYLIGTTIHVPKYLKLKPAWVLTNQEITKLFSLMTFYLPDYAVPDELKLHFTEDR